MEEEAMKNSNFTCGLTVTMSILWLVLLIFVSFKSAVLLISLFSLFMWINTLITTIGNVMIGRDLNPNYDIFWKMLFIIVSSFGFALYFNI